MSINSLQIKSFTSLALVHEPAKLPKGNSLSNRSSQVSSFGKFIFINSLSLYPVQCWCIKLRKQYGHSPFPLWRKSVLNSVPLKIKSIFGFVIYNKLFNNSLVIGLNLPSRPSAILFGIMSLTTNSINRGVTFSKLLYMGVVGTVHVSLKLIKRLPQVLYAFTSIVLKRFMFWFSASADNLSINVIKSSSKHSVFSRSLFKSRNSSTTTGSSVTTSKVIPDHCTIISTITFAIPQGIWVGSTLESYYKKFTEFFTFNIFYSWHTSILARLMSKVKQDCGDNYYIINLQHYV